MKLNYPNKHYSKHCGKNAKKEDKRINEDSMLGKLHCFLGIHAYAYMIFRPDPYNKDRKIVDCYCRCCWKFLQTDYVPVYFNRDTQLNTDTHCNKCSKPLYYELNEREIT